MSEHTVHIEHVLSEEPEFTRRCADGDCCEWTNDAEHCGKPTLPLIKCRAPGCPERFAESDEPCHAKLHEMLAAAEASEAALWRVIGHAAIPLEALHATECDEAGIALSAEVKQAIKEAVALIREAVMAREKTGGD